MGRAGSPMASPPDLTVAFATCKALNQASVVVIARRAINAFRGLENHPNPSSTTTMPNTTSSTPAPHDSGPLSPFTPPMPWGGVGPMRPTFDLSFSAVFASPVARKCCWAHLRKLLARGLAMLEHDAGALVSLGHGNGANDRVWAKLPLRNGVRTSVDGVSLK